MRAAKIRPLARRRRRQYMAQPESELRRQTAGIGLDVLRLGDGILIRMPAAMTFDADSSAVKPQFQATLQGGRADGEDPQPDLRRRARPHRYDRARRRSTRLCRKSAPTAVAAYLAAHGVGKGANRTRKGYGETAPLVVPDDDRDAAAANRRVEIRLVAVPTASAARRRKRAAARPLPPRRSRRARRAGDGRSAGRRCARHARRRRPSGSSAAKRSALIRASAIAAAHIAHGSSVTHKVQSSSRERAELRRRRRGWRPFRHGRSGSSDPRIALRASAMISSSSVTTAPTGTSPAAAASAARSSARRIGGGSGKLIDRAR